MAVSILEADRINRVLTTTLMRYSPNISNELARNDGIVAVFGSKGRIKQVRGGEMAVETLDVSENDSFDFRAYDAAVPTGKKDSRKQAKYAWATVSGSVSIADVEEDENAGDRKIYDLMEAEVNNAKATIIRKIADALRKTTPGANDPESIKTIIEDNALTSQTGSPGGLSKSTYSWWRNQYTGTAIDISANTGLATLLQFIHNDVAKGSGIDDQPDFGLANGLVFGHLSAGHGDANRRFLGVDENVLKLGFQNIRVVNATIICDPSIASGDLYLINTAHMQIQVLLRTGMKAAKNNDPKQMFPVLVRPFQTDPTSFHSVSLMRSTFALTCSSCQRQGIATNIS